MYNSASSSCEAQRALSMLVIDSNSGNQHE
jgi:hypothetical protein